MIFTIEQLLKLSKAELNTVAGGKGSNLVKLVQNGLPVPPFFIVSSRVLELTYIKHWGVELAEDIKASRSDLAERIRQSATSHMCSLEFSSSKLELFTSNACTNFAVRSSALDEDGEKSFAGQLLSFLNVPQEQIVEKIFQVFASSFERQVLAYRKLNRLGAAMIPSVVVQQMIAADSAGVLFSYDPVKLDTDHAVVAITRGLGDKLVDGAIDGNTIYLNRQADAIEEESDLLSRAQAERLLQLLRECETIFSCPQDIEFAIAAGEVYLLQARPITTAKQRETFDTTRVFDGSNIQESYPGITSPLTFSFINSAYQEVYKSFCRLMGVEERVIQAEGDLFSTMLAYIDGRVYYNLASWYRLMALLPAYQTNRSFMEGMMGLSQSASEVSAFDKDETSKKVTARDYFNTVKAIACIGSNYCRLNGQITEFNSRLDLALLDCELESMSLDQLYIQYRSLQAKLLSNWQAPVTNDFFAMVFFGVLKKLAVNAESEEEEKEDSQYVYNLLLQNHGGIISAAPPKLIAQIAALVSIDKELCRAMVARNQSLSMELLKHHTEAHELYLSYLNLFGDRSIGELKLETKSVKDDPAVLLNTIGNLALNGQPSKQSPLPDENKGKDRSKSKSLAKQLLIKIVASQTKQSLAQRENLRFARTRVFGRVRKIVQTMGQRLTEQNYIDCMEDVFYLTVEELLGFIDGTAVSTNLRAIVELRQKESAKFAQSAPERLVLVGATGLKRAHLFTGKERPEDKGGKHGQLVLKGLGASAGIVTGRARVIRNPETEMLEPGEILVADRTDPGWIVHFATCKAIVVAHGSLLSHTAIVARELSIAAVVSCKGALEMIETGDTIEVNGCTGAVSLISRPAKKESESHAIPA
jgi:pyruvate,water dikinase